MEGVLYFLYHAKLGKFIIYLPSEIRNIIYKQTKKAIVKLNICNVYVFLKIM